MLFATNGRPQDLPPDTQFLFWDEADNLRAFKVAMIEAQEAVGIPQYVYDSNVSWVNKLITAVREDVCATFTSRPVGQAIDWPQWARFARWYFYKSYGERQDLCHTISAGNCGTWLGGFLSAMPNLEATMYRSHCYTSSEQIDRLIWYEHVPFDSATCAAAPNIAQAGLFDIAQALGVTINDLLAGKNVPPKGFADPGTVPTSFHPAGVQTGAGDVPVVPGGQPPSSSGSSTSSLLPIVAIGGLVVLAIGAAVMMSGDKRR